MSDVILADCCKLFSKILNVEIGPLKVKKDDEIFSVRNQVFSLYPTIVIEG